MSIEMNQVAQLKIFFIAMANILEIPLKSSRWMRYVLKASRREIKCAQWVVHVHRQLEIKASRGIKKDWLLVRAECTLYRGYKAFDPPDPAAALCS